MFCLHLQDPHAEEFEDKEWTFVIENVSTKYVFVFCHLLSFHIFLHCYLFCSCHGWTCSRSPGLSCIKTFDAFNNKAIPLFSSVIICYMKVLPPCGCFMLLHPSLSVDLNLRLNLLHHVGSKCTTAWRSFLCALLKYNSHFLTILLVPMQLSTH